MMDENIYLFPFRFALPDEKDLTDNGNVNIFTVGDAVSIKCIVRSFATILYILMSKLIKYYILH